MIAPLVLAKAPVAGEVKTRLAAGVGARRAADLAAAALLDTLEVVTRAFPTGPRVIALSGDVAQAERSAVLSAALDGWLVLDQRGAAFGERLAHAHADARAATGSGVLQIGMDTPQLTTDMLTDAADRLDRHDGVLGLAEDGGWWVLGLRDPRHAGLLRDVPMSTRETGMRTLAALSTSVSMTTTTTTYDVDTVVEAERAATDAPDTRFAAAWRGRS